MSTWKDVIREAEARIQDPARRAKLGALMERVVELTLEAALGRDVEADLKIVGATIKSLGSAELATVQQAAFDALWDQIRHFLYAVVFKVPV